MTANASKPTVDTNAASAWQGFSGALWQREIHVRAFIQLNYTPHEGDESFLRGGRGNVERLEVLPFHQMGRFKWERLGLDYTLQNVEPPTAESAERAREVFRKVGLRAY